MENEKLSKVTAELVATEIAKEVVKSYLEALDDLQKQADELERQIEATLE